MNATMRWLTLLFLLLLAPNPPSALVDHQLASDLPVPSRRLRGYLSVDTTNPPGREQSGALYLAELLRDEGIDSRLVTTPRGRTSLWARVRAQPDVDGPALALLHHIDVVAAGEGWTHPPFGARIASGALWGRGAVDAKSLGIAQLEAFLAVARDPRPRNRDVILLATADEEGGGEQGVGFLLDQHPELFANLQGVLNEGGSNRQINGRLLWFGVEVAQKRPLWLRLTVEGRGGHAATYNPGSALHELTRALARLVDLPAAWRVSTPVAEYYRALAPLQNERWAPLFRDIAAVIEPTGPTVGLMPGMETLFLDTVQVTGVQGSTQINVVSDRATAEVDIRLLPDTDDAAFLARLQEALGPRIGVEVLVKAPRSSPSPTGGPLYELLEQSLDPDAPVVPYFSPGFTDSRYFRERGIPAYGFSPFALEPQELGGIHDSDEFLSIERFEEGVARLHSIVEGWVYGEGSSGL